MKQDELDHLEGKSTDSCRVEQILKLKIKIF